MEHSSFQSKFLLGVTSVVLQSQNDTNSLKIFSFGKHAIDGELHFLRGYFNHQLTKERNFAWLDLGLLRPIHINFGDFWFVDQSDDGVWLEVLKKGEDLVSKVSETWKRGSYLVKNLDRMSGFHENHL